MITLTGAGTFQAKHVIPALHYLIQVMEESRSAESRLAVVCWCLEADEQLTATMRLAGLDLLAHARGLIAEPFDPDSQETWDLRKNLP